MCPVCVSSYKYGDGLKDAKRHGANTGGGLTRDPRGESGRAEARRGQSRRDDGTDGHERMEWGTADARCVPCGGRPRAPLRSGYLSVFVTQGLELPSPRPSQPACMREAHTRPTGPSYTSGLGRVPRTRGGQALGPALPVAYPDARPYPGARRHNPTHRGPLPVCMYVCNSSP